MIFRLIQYMYTLCKKHYSLCLIVLLLATLTLLFYYIHSYSGQSYHSYDYQKKSNTFSEQQTQSLFSSTDNYTIVKVGIYENKPKIFIDASGNPAGIFPTILNEIARREHWRIVYVPCDWSGFIDSLQKGAIDLMPDVAFSFERNSVLSFNTETVVSSWSTIYAKDRNQFDRISDLSGKKIAVLNGSIQKSHLEQLFHGFGLTAQFIETPTFEAAFEMVEQGSADAVASNHFFGDLFHKNFNLQNTAIVFNPASLYFASFSPRNKDLLSSIDKHLRDLKAESGSVYYKTLQEWMDKPPAVVIPPFIVILIFIIITMLTLALVFIFLLRWQLSIRTKRLENANAEIVANEKKFHEFFNNHAAVKIVIDPESGSIVEANSAAVAFYGWPIEVLKKMNIRDINTLTPEQIALKMEHARSKKQIHFEFKHRLANGSIRDVAVFSSGVTCQGKQLLYSIIHDITEHRLVEEQLLHSQKQEFLGRLAGGIAHDYNNMLGIIIGYTEMALHKSTITNPIHTYLNEILTAAKRSAEITQQLLTFARKQPVNQKIININTAVTELLNVIKRLTGENIQLNWFPGNKLWPISIDPGQLNQILINLCVNARDAIDDTGAITIITENVTISTDVCKEHGEYIPGDFAQLTVVDTGHGMDAETQLHIFEPFYTTKEVGKGTGLGLATLYGITTQNGGFITVKSAPGSGSTFNVYLPRHTGDTIENPAPPEQKRAPKQHYSILLVEDEPLMLKIAAMMLEKEGYTVFSAHNHSEAIVLAEQHAATLDLLVTDIIMPQVNGRDLARTIQSFVPQIKTLYMSGYTADTIALKEVNQHGLHFIQKPFTTSDLTSKIETILATP